MNMEILIQTMTTWAAGYAFKIVAAVLVFIIGKWIARKIAGLAVRLAEKQNIDTTLIKFLDNIIYYVLMVVVFIAAAGQLGIETTSFLTIVGAAGLAIALALKDSLSDIASGVMLIMFRHYRIGDYITAGGASGTVVNIAMFSTTLHTPDNKKVIVPNSKITADVITNVTANDIRRVDLVIGISYEDDIKKAREILESVIKKETRVLDDPAYNIAVSELAESSVNFVVRPWVKTDGYWDVYFDLTEKIKTTFDEQGISIPYPQQDVHLRKE